MSTIDSNGQNIGFAVVGAPLGTAGIPVLMYHGTTMDRSAWDPVIGSMPTQHTYIQIDFPGSGESSMPLSPLTVPGLVADALNVLDHLKVEEFHVAGFSLGAVIAAATAALVPKRVRSATMLCGWKTTDARMRLTFDLWKNLIAIDPTLFMKYAFVDGFTASTLTALEPMIEAMLPTSKNAIALGSEAHLELDIIIDISDLCSEIVAPCLVISGQQDRWVDPSHCQELADAIAGSRYVSLPAGHLVIQELAGDVAQLLSAHISQGG
ncbi:MAG: alpha/beta hydrolase [Actinomycetes bacterium]